MCGSNQITKDLVADGTATTNLTFTTEELEEIYQKNEGNQYYRDKKCHPKKELCPTALYRR